MTLTNWYWLAFAIYALTGCYYGYADRAARPLWFATPLLLLILLFIIGLRAFGPFIE